MSRIHDQSPQAKTANPPADMTGDVANPQKTIVMPSATRNGAYDGVGAAASESGSARSTVGSSRISCSTACYSAAKYREAPPTRSGTWYHDDKVPRIAPR